MYVHIPSSILSIIDMWGCLFSALILIGQISSYFARMHENSIGLTNVDIFTLWCDNL